MDPLSANNEEDTNGTFLIAAHRAAPLGVGPYPRQHNPLNVDRRNHGDDPLCHGVPFDVLVEGGRTQRAVRVIEAMRRSSPSPASGTVAQWDKGGKIYSVN